MPSVPAQVTAVAGSKYLRRKEAIAFIRVSGLGYGKLKGFNDL